MVAVAVSAVVRALAAFALAALAVAASRSSASQPVSQPGHANEQLGQLCAQLLARSGHRRCVVAVESSNVQA